MQKITFVRRQHTPFGGAERYLERLVDVLKNRGYETEIRHLEQPKWMPSWLKFLYYDHQACSSKGERFYFSNDRLTCLDIYRAGGGVHKVFLKTKGFSLNPLHPVYLHLEKRAFENALTIIANSQMVKNEIIETYGIDPKKIEVIYNGVPLEPFDKRASKKRLVEEFGIAEEEKIILYVGSGFERKGVAELLQLLVLLKSDFKAFVVGKEKQLNRYRQMVRDMGLDKRVFFTGPREDVSTFYAAADIFILPTHYEPFSNVVLEALSYENIVFTTRQNGASEILDERFIMASPGDVSIVAEIEKLLEDKAYLESTQTKAGEIAQQYTIEANADKTVEVIRQTMEKRASSGIQKERG